MAGFLLITALQALLTGLICIAARPVGERLGLIDDPSAKDHACHMDATPLVGGLAIFIPWLIASCLGAALGVLPTSNPGQYLTWLVTALFFTLGALDDRYCLRAWHRLASMFILYGLLTALVPALRVEAIPLPGTTDLIPLGWLAVPATAFGLVAATNAVNMADGRNGLVLGLALIWSTALASVAPAHISLRIAELLPSIAMVLAFNLRGRLFLGDAGTYSLSALCALGALALHSLSPEQGGINTGQLASLFAVPALDMIRLVVMRLRWGRSPMAADQDHLHHRLDRRLGWGLGLPAYLATAGMPIAVAFYWPQWAGPAVFLAGVSYLAAWAATRPQGLGRTSCA